MKRLCSLGFFIFIFFVFFLLKTPFVNACSWVDKYNEYGNWYDSVCTGGCGWFQYCSVDNGCGCEWGFPTIPVPTVSIVPLSTNTPVPSDFNPGPTEPVPTAASCDYTNPCHCGENKGTSWCDNGECRCDISYVTPTPGINYTCRWGACTMVNGVCGQTAYCSSNNAYYDWRPCGCGSNPTSPLEPTNVPAVTPYPTSAVSGNLYIKSVGACEAYPNVAITPAIHIIPLAPGPVQSNCTTNLTNGTYLCHINYDNSLIIPPLSQSFSLTTTSQSYGAGRWQVNNLCEGNFDNLRTITAGDVITGWSVFYKVVPWFKIQGGSFSSGGLNFSIPDTVTKFDSDDMGNRYLVDGESGAVTTNSVFPAASALPISQKNWSKENYSRAQLMSSSGWISYIKSRKKFTTITNLNEITKDGIYYYSGNLSISQAPAFNVVLVVDGNAIITNNFTQTSGFALVSTGQFGVDPSVTQINGVFVTPNFDTGAATTGLKIVGNISTSTLNNDRNLTDNSKPSIFVLFDPNTYLKLLPYLSVSKYDWRQTQ